MGWERGSPFPFSELEQLLDLQICRSPMDMMRADMEILLLTFMDQRWWRQILERYNQFLEKTTTSSRIKAIRLSLRQAPVPSTGNCV